MTQCLMHPATVADCVAGQQRIRDKGASVMMETERLRAVFRAHAPRSPFRQTGRDRSVDVDMSGAKVDVRPLYSR